MRGATGNESLSSVVRRLAAAQKAPTPGTPAYSRFVNRRLGRLLAAVAYRAGLTPNQVTAVSAAFTFTAIALVALVRPAVWSALVVAAGLVLGYAFDAADGQLARLRGGGSPAGEWLDHVVDAFKVSAVHLAVLVAWFRFFDLPAAGLLVPLGFTLVAAGLFFATWLTDQMRRAHPAGARPPAGASRAAVVRSLLVAPTDYGVLVLAFVTLGWRPVFVTLYTALFAATALFVLAALPKWFREVRSFAPPRVTSAGA